MTDQMTHRYTHCTRVAPGCHGGPDSLGGIVSRHGSLDLAERAARRNDRLVVVALDADGWPDDEVLYGIPSQGHPVLGDGRYGQSV